VNVANSGRFMQFVLRIDYYPHCRSFGDPQGSDSGWLLRTAKGGRVTWFGKWGQDRNGDYAPEHLQITPYSFLVWLILYLVMGWFEAPSGPDPSPRRFRNLGFRKEMGRRHSAFQSAILAWPIFRNGAFRTGALSNQLQQAAPGLARL